MQTTREAIDQFVLSGGRVVDPACNVDAVMDIGVADGLIVPVDSLPDAPRIDVAGCVVAPGFIDVHVHLRDPGQTHKEDVASGTAAAAAGGFTTVIAMPNTSPVLDSPAALDAVRDTVAEHARVRVLQTASLSIGQNGRELTDAQSLRRAGAVALTDDGGCIGDNHLMLRALEQAAEAGIPVMDHCEDPGVADSGLLHAGRVAATLGLPGKNRASEELIVARNAVLARETGCPVHLQHISSAGSVQIIRCAQASGIPLTAEATPHHICLTDEACLEYGSNAKMNPPLREESDRQAIIGALADGTIAMIATDHAPHTDEEKALGFRDAPCGIIGLESAVSLCLSELYGRGHLSLVQVIAAFTAGPRQAFNLPWGTLAEGTAADITVLDTELEGMFDVSAFRSKSRNCPYHGWRFRGAVIATLMEGRFVYVRPGSMSGMARTPG